MANIRTFHDLQVECLSWLDEAGDTDVTLTLVKQAIRAAHEKRLLDERWAFMLSKPKTFATVANQQTYTLDADFQRLMYVKNLTTTVPMHEYTDQNMFKAGYDIGVDTDSATAYALWGHSEVQNQPTSGSVVRVTSSNSADNNVSSVTVRGDTATGVQTETILCSNSGTISFTELLKITKSDSWGGTMTLTTNSAAVTNLTLASAEYGKSFQTFQLLAIPTAAETLEYRFYRQPSPLVANNDRPDYPAPFEELLVWEALCDMAVYNNYTDSMVAYWSSKRAALLLSMQQATNQAQSVDQAAVYTTYIPR